MEIRAKVKRITIDVRHFNNFDEDNAIDAIERALRDYDPLSVIKNFSAEDVSEKYDSELVNEYCPYCDSEVTILANEWGICPECKTPLLPCSECGECTLECPFTSEENDFIQLLTFPSNDDDYGIVFKVNKNWLIKYIRGIDYDSLEGFLKSYTWDESYIIYEKLKGTEYFREDDDDEISE